MGKIRDWSVAGPSELVLTKQQVAAELHINEQALERLIRAGHFPRGTKLSPQAEPIWAGVEVACWLRIRHLLGVDEKGGEANEKKKSE
jgi:hypothetical protein